ncbi:unnamed protein product [Calypogeia fissa]
MGERHVGGIPDDLSSVRSSSAQAEEAIRSGAASPAADGVARAKIPGRGTPGSFTSDLHAAAQENDVRLFAEILSQRDVDVNARDENGRTALWIASLEGHADIVKLLLEQDIHELDVYSYDHDYGFNALHLASSWGHTDVVKHLLVYERRIHSCRLLLAPVSGNSWFTSLHLAVDNDHPQIVYELKVACLWATIEGSEDVYEQVFNATDSEGYTALHIAAQKSTLLVISELLKWEQGDFNMYGNNGFTPLHLACLRNDSRIVARLLEDARVDVNAATKFHPSSTPLHLAALENSPELVRTLSTHSSLMPNTRDYDGIMPLQIAVESGDDNIQSLLLRLPDVKHYVSKLYKDRQAYIHAASAMLIGAAVISGVSCSGWLQPPLGFLDHRDSLSYAAVEQDMSVQVFWVFNSLTFFSACATVVSGAAAVLPGQDAFIGKSVSRCHGWLRGTSRLLALSIVFLLGAFMAAGFASLPPNLQYEAIMIATGSVGVIVCLVLLVFLKGRLRKPRFRAPVEKVVDTYSSASPDPSRRSSFKAVEQASMYPAMPPGTWPPEVGDLVQRLDKMRKK